MPGKELENFSVPEIEASSSVSWEERIISIWESLKNRSRKFKNSEVKSIELKFYPYKNGNHSIGFYNGLITAKFHSSLETADETVKIAFLSLLISKLLGLKPLPIWKEQVGEFLHSIPESNSGKFKKLKESGFQYDLREMLERISEAYFPKIDVKLLAIGWSDRLGKRRLGSYEKQNMGIRISPILDHKDVPYFVLEHVVHHEILHHILPTRMKNGQNSIHSPEFKRKEKEYVRYREAINWLKMEYPKFLIKNQKEIAHRLKSEFYG
ncbi:SprT-like domain-containing protein [Leptospira sarikeiensis]|uniref:M48 family peptidase n=1 Tax=Leptospira sarikeiensis TaxID=2484943 RepID=A0A4R9K1Q9_9LEPT|nr:SprT-like domain-containing protein [Leptospira sarikeiensis]TGL59643.1 M48 family peptidase [Leptospira sarikeiensis]